MGLDLKVVLNNPFDLHDPVALVRKLEKNLKLDISFFGKGYLRVDKLSKLFFDSWNFELGYHSKKTSTRLLPFNEFKIPKGYGFHSITTDVITKANFDFTYLGWILEMQNSVWNADILLFNNLLESSLYFPCRWVHFEDAANAHFEWFDLELFIPYLKMIHQFGQVCQTNRIWFFHDNSDYYHKFEEMRDYELWKDFDTYMLCHSKGKVKCLNSFLVSSEVKLSDLSNEAEVFYLDIDRELDSIDLIKEIQGFSDHYLEFLRTYKSYS
ncbi:hypothetical protein BST97_03415 [Nonlabens spongiae]|uniref:Uncharacterized protein n=1 Tax=Nonlabens spongiae TaxID=331648 RepID=A0A1W6MHS6_9FLAO|nr:hypothetical protein [Nonlabens spongiae]ARN77117.1 hypothetical protein BST97_03415 [Nonlabens spongiae]